MAYDSRDTLSSATTLDEIKDVPTLPRGHYYGTVRRFECRDDVGDNKRSVVDFYVGLTRPGSDIDPSKVDGIDLSEYELQRTFWFTPRGMPELRDFLRSFKFAGNVPLDALYHETVGHEVLCTVSPATFKSRRTGKDISTSNLDDIVAVVEDITDLSKSD